ncbi:MAG: methyltransferase domain-containing protein [Lachnospiraceae bacterium]|nr:methyltransferase domain-containing protein [Lachnospiraceae bacterium]
MIKKKERRYVNMIHFKLAELRKKNNLTQQELGDILNVSYQTISKWENSVVFPDISVLPQISSYFGVSVDALLGLVPLGEEYSPSNSGTVEYWNQRLDYLKMTRKSMWNEDYFQFLITAVWNINKPITVLDCGCGYGALGLLIMPLLPEGSKYTGIDFSETMIESAKKIYRDSGISAEFVLSDILSYQPKEKYDMVISQAVLRHVDDGERFLRKMAEFLKKDGILVSMECNREFEADGLYIRGMDYSRLCQHEGLNKLWQTELQRQNRDYSIAMKIPHYMKKMGLKNISTRMNDRVTFLEPEQEMYDELLESIIKADYWDDEKTDAEIEADISYFMNHGMSRKEAEDYCRQQNGIVKYLKKNREKAAITKATGYMISYGWKV